MRSALVLASALLLSGCAVFTAPGAYRPADRESLTDERTGEAKTAAPEAADAGHDKFGGKLFLVLLDDKTHPSLRDGRSLWATTKDITYTPFGGTDTIRVPKGFVTDLASIPRIFWGLLPPDGPWVKAAVVHDYLYYTHGSGVWHCHKPTISRAAPYSKLESDRILREAMEDRRVDAFRSNIIYLAVHLGGQNGWDNSPGPDPDKKCNGVVPTDAP